MTEGKRLKTNFRFHNFQLRNWSFTSDKRILLFEEYSSYESDDFFVSGKIEKYRTQVFPGHEKSLQMRVFKTEIISVGFESIILYRSRLFTRKIFVYTY